jgi:hypothetical protein
MGAWCGVDLCSPVASPYLSLGANTLLPGATYVFFVAPVLQPDLAIATVSEPFQSTVITEWSLTDAEISWLYAYIDHCADE